MNKSISQKTKLQKNTQNQPNNKWIFADTVKHPKRNKIKIAYILQINYVLFVCFWVFFPLQHEWVP